MCLYLAVFKLVRQLYTFELFKVVKVNYRNRLLVLMTTPVGRIGKTKQ